MSIRPAGSRRHTVTGIFSLPIKDMSQCWNSETIYARSLVTLRGSDGQNGFHRRARQITAALSLSQLKHWTPESQLHLHSFFLKIHFDCIWNCFWGKELFVFHLSTTREIVIIVWNVCLSAVICFKPPVAKFHLDDEWQLYGQPSLPRTIGSRVSCNCSLSKTQWCHTGWAMLLPACAYWLKYLLVVPLLTCNLPQQQPGSPD